MNLAEHPTVKAFYEKAAQAPTPSAPTKLDANWLRQLCREAGADDVGLVEIGRPALSHRSPDPIQEIGETSNA